MSGTVQKKWDVFISHVSEDKESFVRPLAVALRRLGVEVWYDEFVLRPGFSLSESIDKGLTESRYGLVIISPSFLSKSKGWHRHELRGLVNRDVREDHVIIPIWHGVTEEAVRAVSPPLADKLAIITAGSPAQDISLRVLRAVRLDLYEKHPRSHLERIASGEAMAELQCDLEEVQQQLKAAHLDLSDYRCRYCGASASSRNETPLDDEQRDWGIVQTFSCGHQTVDGVLECPCPKDPKFPEFDDYELIFRERPDGTSSEWHCYAKPKTSMARMVHLSEAPGRTKEQAASRVRELYDERARVRR
jgi:hypothetical protein